MLNHDDVPLQITGNIAEGQEQASLQPSFNEEDENAAAAKASKRPPKKKAKNAAPS